MADINKNIVITPNTGQISEPIITLTGQSNNPIALRVLDDNTLSFEGSAGQLFSISPSLTGTIFSVNDISGIPSIEVDDTGEVRIAEFSGNVGIGMTSPVYKLDITGIARATSFIGDIAGNASTATKLATTRAITLAGDVTGTANFDGSGNISITAVVVDDSHNHIVSNIDGLQGALDGKVDNSQVLTNVPTGALFTDTVYTHPTYIGDDISVDTGALTGAVVVSDVDFNITTDTLGHIVDANGVIATRTLTLANLGYTGATNANYFTYSLPVASTALGGIKTGTDITIDASGNVSVVDDSHNHIVSNIDGLQGALDGKVDNSQVLTNVPTGALFTDTIYTHPLGDGNLHVPATLTINEGKVLTAGATAGSLSWVAPSFTYSLPVATTSIGGVKSGTDISVDASGNVSVVDDSHNHVTGNVDGLDTALGLKLDKSAIVASTLTASGGVDGDIWFTYV